LRWERSKIVAEDEAAGGSLQCLPPSSLATASTWQKFKQQQKFRKATAQAFWDKRRKEMEVDAEARVGLRKCFGGDPIALMHCLLSCRS
jgi:hypothetical protein